jgi:hypothetical protein
MYFSYSKAYFGMFLVSDLVIFPKYQQIPFFGFNTRPKFPIPDAS